MKKQQAERKDKRVSDAPMFAVMKVFSWESLEVLGMPLSAPANGPHKFIPVFETRAQAVAFNNGSEENIGIVNYGTPHNVGKLQEAL